MKPPARKPLAGVRGGRRARRRGSADRAGGRGVGLVPHPLPPAEEREWVDRMLQRLDAREARARRTDAELVARAARLVQRYLPELPADLAPSSLRWVDNQHGRWGSCTPADRTIRISARIMDMPD